MDGSTPGEVNVFAWCNALRLQLVSDPNRQILHGRIKGEGFEFLDNYLENALAKPTEGYDVMLYVVLNQMP